METSDILPAGASGGPPTALTGISTEEVERPVRETEALMQWGSDAIAQALRELEIPYVALNPGASFRGLHDSLVNYLGNRDPQLLLCLHDEHAVAIAHGFAKVTRRPMAAILHSNVGLMHGAMAIFNAYCDRVPMLILGPGGPMDAAARRPWIDWLHTAADPAALVRPYVKWDDQPASIEAAIDSVFRGHMLTATTPCAPVYVSLDVELQEQALPQRAEMPSVGRFGAAPGAVHPDPADIDRLGAWLRSADRVVILAGRGSIGKDAWENRIELAERVGGRVFSHVDLPASFPTDHPCCGGVVPPVEPTDELVQCLRRADVILSLDWLDLGGTLKAAIAGPVRGKLAVVSPDQHLHNGWTKAHQAPFPADLRVLADPDATVRRLLADSLRETTSRVPQARQARPIPELESVPVGDRGLGIAHIAAALRAALDGHPACLIRVPLLWPGDLWPTRDPLDYLGGDGGGGLGSGPGMAVGAALALRNTGRIALAITGDGDFMMGATALWTAARYRLPLLLVVMNNRSYFNDELHQHRIALRRSRPTANRWIGQRIDDPVPDVVSLARAQGALGFGPVRDLGTLRRMADDAVEAVRAGATAVLDVWTACDPDPDA